MQVGTRFLLDTDSKYAGEFVDLNLLPVNEQFFYIQEYIYKIK